MPFGQDLSNQLVRDGERADFGTKKRSLAPVLEDPEQEKLLGNLQCRFTSWVAGTPWSQGWDRYHAARQPIRSHPNQIDTARGISKPV